MRACVSIYIYIHLCVCCVCVYACRCVYIYISVCVCVYLRLIYGINSWFAFACSLAFRNVTNRFRLQLIRVPRPKLSRLRPPSYLGPRTDFQGSVCPTRSIFWQHLDDLRLLGSKELISLLHFITFYYSLISLFLTPHHTHLQQSTLLFWHAKAISSKAEPTEICGCADSPLLFSSWLWDPVGSWRQKLSLPSLQARRCRS